MKNVFLQKTTLVERNFTPIRSFYELLGPVRKLRKELGLTPNDLAVLTALISFLPREGRRDRPDVDPSMSIVFPSNAKLAERANDVDERTLRRCLGRLASSGLITRKNSANCKRFPLRYGGSIRDAFGFDLLPLMQRHESLSRQAEEADRELERIRSLKAEALALRAAVLERPDLAVNDLAVVTAMRNLLRRSTLTVKALLEAIRQLRAMAGEVVESYGERSAPITSDCYTKRTAQPEERRETTEMTGRDGQNVRHKESTKIDFKTEPCGKDKPQERKANDTANALKRDPTTMQWEDFKNVSAFYPEPKRAEELTSIVIEMGKHLQIRQEQLLKSISFLGLGRVLLLIDYLMDRVGDIVNPEAYLMILANNAHRNVDQRIHLL